MLMKKVYIETLGCQMNKAETERILGMLSFLGYEETEKPKEADLLIINTCSIRQLSADKAYSQLGLWGKWKKTKNNLKIGMCGCVAQQDSKKIFQRAPYVDLVFGTHNLYELPELIKRIENDEKVCAITEPPYKTDETKYPIIRKSGYNAWIPII